MDLIEEGETRLEILEEAGEKEEKEEKGVD